MRSEIKRAATRFCGPAVDVSQLALVFAPILPTELSCAMKVDAGGLGERESIAASGPQKLHHLPHILCMICAFFGVTPKLFLL